MAKLVSIPLSGSAHAPEPPSPIRTGCPTEARSTMMAFRDDTLTVDDEVAIEAARSESAVSTGSNQRPSTDWVQQLECENVTPGTLESPAFVMNCPFSYSADQPNNAWMYELDENARQVDRTKAIAQFARLYNHMASDGFVFLLPTPKDCKLQDLVFTANLGIVLEHVPERNIVVLSNFTSEPRFGETQVGQG